MPTSPIECFFGLGIFSGVLEVLPLSTALQYLLPPSCLDLFSTKMTAVILRKPYLCSEKENMFLPFRQIG